MKVIDFTKVKYEKSAAKKERLETRMEQYRQLKMNEKIKQSNVMK